LINVGRNDGNGLSVESAGQEPDSAIVASSEIGSENTPKEKTPHLVLIPGRELSRAGWMSLIPQQRPTRATPPHPPNDIGDGGQIDAREDPSSRSATHTTSSLAPEAKPLLRSAWPDVAPGTSSYPLRPLQVPASYRRGYSSELTLHPIEVSITHVEEMGTSVVGKLSQELTTREARTRAVFWRRHDELETAAGPPRDTFGRSMSPSARNRLLPAALQLRGWDSNPQPTD
jgi:hypothetical protein